MAEVHEAQEILQALGMPPDQQNRMSGLTLIALCGLKLDSPWSLATRSARTVTKGIMDHIGEHYEVQYAPNTRETFRRKVLHQFVQGRIAGYNPFAPDLPTNSPRAHYAITSAALKAVQRYDTPEWKSAVAEFRREQGTLTERHDRERDYHMVPIRFPDGRRLQLSPGQHNKVQKAIVEEFSPRFAPGAHLLYLGDTDNKGLHVDPAGLTRLGISITDHDKLPDIVLHDEDREWLLLIEAVTSHGPMTPTRVLDLEDLFKASLLGSVYVSAFPDFAEFRKHLNTIAWETEVWIADAPDHLIHYDGDRFLGPRK